MQKKEFFGTNAGDWETVVMQTKPTKCLHTVATKLALGAVESLGQSTHVKKIVAPDSSEYLPAVQAVHSAELVVSLYLPGTHAEHTAVSGPVY